MALKIGTEPAYLRKLNIYHFHLGPSISDPSILEFAEKKVIQSPNHGEFSKVFWKTMSRNGHDIISFFNFQKELALAVILVVSDPESVHGARRTV